MHEFFDLMVIDMIEFQYGCEVAARRLNGYYTRCDGIFTKSTHNIFEIYSHICWDSQFKISKSVINMRKKYELKPLNGTETHWIAH